jgi:hypothetical protein
MTAAEKFALAANEHARLTGRVESGYIPSEEELVMWGAMTPEHIKKIVREARESSDA